jgi:hypothetical protein
VFGIVAVFVFSAVFAAAAEVIYVYSLTALDPVAFASTNRSSSSPW